MMRERTLYKKYRQFMEYNQEEYERVQFVRNITGNLFGLVVATFILTTIGDDLVEIVKNLPEPDKSRAEEVLETRAIY